MVTVYLKPSLMVMLVTLLVLSVSSTGVAQEGGAVSALILTNKGELAEGSLTGIFPTIRLDPLLAATPSGLARPLDIPVSDVLQITVDFPRLVVETEEQVYIGPLSAFTGIDELLLLHQKRKVLEFPTAGLRAIALNGNPLRPAPRVWLGNHLLSMPEVAVASPQKEGSGATVESVTEELIYSPMWEDLYPTPVAEPTQESPWWLSILIVTAIAVLVYLSFAAS